MGVAFFFGRIYGRAGEGWIVGSPGSEAGKRTGGGGLPARRPSSGAAGAGDRSMVRGKARSFDIRDFRRVSERCRSPSSLNRPDCCRVDGQGRRTTSETSLNREHRRVGSEIV